jgi:DNA invertase Pin-like site-specific DNA recombinase
MRVVLYARCSSRDKGQNPETQLIPLRDFARAKQWEIAGEFIDHGWSGAKEKRPALDQVMRLARRRQIDGVLVWRFDRFARSTSHLLAALDEFRKLERHFISMCESIDTSTPIGKMVFTILGAVAEMERELIRERVNAGLDRARRQGKRFGRPPAAVSFSEVVTMRTGGATLYQIAKEKGISRSTVRAILERGEKPTAAGELSPKASR